MRRTRITNPERLTGYYVDFSVEEDEDGHNLVMRIPFDNKGTAFNEMYMLLRDQEEEEK